MGESLKILLQFGTVTPYLVSASRQMMSGRWQVVARRRQMMSASGYEVYGTAVHVLWFQRYSMSNTVL